MQENKNIYSKFVKYSPSRGSRFKKMEFFERLYAKTLKKELYS